jgi:pyruvate formate lyase activating enzyme
METCGFADSEKYKAVAPYVDIFLWDYKITNSDEHKKYTGVDNRLIKANLKTLCESGKEFVARIPLIPGVNDSVENMQATAELLQGAKGLQRVELLRYHKTAGAKYPMVGIDYVPGFDEDKTPEIHDTFTERNIKLLIL